VVAAWLHAQNRAIVRHDGETALRRELTRGVLYDLVWARPMTKVAADLGLSDVALKKICRKHKVPTPGRGYWAKLAAGKPARRVRLPEIGDGALDRIAIHGSTLRSMPEQVADAREAAKAKTETSTQETPPGPAPDPEAVVRLIERLRRRLARGRSRADSLIHVAGRGLIPVAVAPLRAGRALRILETLLGRAAAIGYALKLDGEGAGLVVEGEFLSLAIFETMSRVPHEPTEKEQRALRRWQAEREERIARGMWVPELSDFGKPHIPEWDELPSGKLVIEIDRGEHRDGLRRRFSDTKRRRIEAMIDVVLVGVATCAAAAEARREEAARRAREIERERKEQKQREKERRRDAAFEKRETRRVAFVDAVHEQLALRDRLSAVLAHLEGDTSEDAWRTEAMLDWLQRRLRQIDALISRLFLELSAQSVNVDFREAEADDEDASASRPWAHSSNAELQYWSIDREAGLARSTSVRQWLIEAGLVPDPKPDGKT